MLRFRTKALGERNEPKFIENARLLYLTFLHGREDKCQHHWHHFQTDLIRNIHHTGVLLNAIRLFIYFFKFVKPFSFQKTICQQ